jgi:adenosylhomocysteine nucleosidase
MGESVAKASTATAARKVAQATAAAAAPWLIVSAMPEEIGALRARNGAARIGAQAVTMSATGDGERNARQGLAALLAAGPVGRLVALGVAGGLTPDLREGALVVAERVIPEGRPQDELRADPALVRWVADATGARPGIIISARNIADSVAEKQRLRALANAAGAAVPAVVDLESASYATAAHHMGIPWIMLRAVSDPAEEALPALLNRCRDEGGAVRRAAVARALLSEPAALPALLSLRRRVRAAAEALALAVEALVRTAPTAPEGGPA